MQGDSDDFDLDNTDDLEIDHHDESQLSFKAKTSAAGSGLFSTADDDFGADNGSSGSRRVSTQPLRQLPAGSGSRRRSTGRFGENDNYDFREGSSNLPPRGTPSQPPRSLPVATSNRGGSSGLFSSNEDDFGAGLDPRPPPEPQLPPRPLLAPAHHRGSSGLFSKDDSNDDDYSLDDLGAEIDHGGGPPVRQVSTPAADFTNPSLSLDANDSDIAELLGPQIKAAAPGAPRPSVRPPARTPPPPLPDSPGGYGLEAEDSELAELLAESPRDTRPRPALATGQSSNRRISFQEPIAEPLQSPASVVQPQVRRLPHPQAIGRPDSGSFGVDSEEGYGLERDARKDLNGRPARQANPSEDLASGDDYGDVTFDERVLAAPARPAPGAGASFKRVPAVGSGYDPIEDPLDSPVARSGGRAPRGIAPRRQVDESNETYLNYDNDYDDYEEDYDNDMYEDPADGRGDRRSGGGMAFRRIPSPTRGPQPPRPAAPSPPGDDDYEDEFEDDVDVFADDESWDGEIRYSARGGRVVTAARPGSARQPRSRGLRDTGGTRMRATSALPPRERQAAMIADMMRRHPSSWDTREVATWVEFIGMGQYRPKFVHNCVDGDLLLSLGDAELSRDLRILPLGHRRALLAAIAQLRELAASIEQQRGEGPGAPEGAGRGAKSETARIADLRRRAAEQEVGRRPSSIGGRIIPPEPFLGPAAGKITVYEQRAKLLYQLDRARHRAAQHAAIIEQLSNNKALTEAQMAELRGKLKDLETKHKDEFSPTHRRGMTASVSPGGSVGGGRKGAAALVAAEYGADAAVPWLPVGRGTRSVNPHPERFARDGEDPNVDLTFRPRVGRIEEVPAGAVRDIVAKALSSRTPFWHHLEFEFEKMRKEREAREEARRKRRERMGVVRRGGGEGDDEEQAKSPYWNNYWVPNSNKNVSSHKKFKRGSENEELTQYRSFAKDKMRLSRWFKRFVDDDERTEGDVTLERLINQMIRALAKTKDEVEFEVGDTFDKRVRTYFHQHGYKFETHVSKTIMVRARGTRPPAPPGQDTTTYDFEEVEQYYPDYLKKKSMTAQDDTGGGDDDENEAYMVYKRTTWKRLFAMYYMERQKKIRAAIAMVKMSQFVQRHGVRWPPERDRDEGKKDVWVPSSGGGALHQLDGRDRTFNTVGQDNISLHAKLKKALSPPQPVTFQMKQKEQEEQEAKAEALFALMGWPHSSGDPDLGRPMDPFLSPDGGGGEGFGLTGEERGEPGRQQRWQPQLDFFGALDDLLNRAVEMRRVREDWLDSLVRARERGYGEEDLSPNPPRAQDLNWRNDDPLMEMQNRAMERQRQEWLLAWEKARRARERQATKMRSQGYREEDIDLRLGPQQEVTEVENAIENHLIYNIEMLSRLKEKDLQRFMDLKGTKKKMTVYRALRTQMFLDEAQYRNQRKEDWLQATYESLRPGTSRRLITAEEQEAIYARLKEDEEKREARRRTLLEEKRKEEEASLTPWYLLSRSTSRIPSQPASHVTSPGRGPSPPGRRSTRSPTARNGAASTSRQRPSSATRSRRNSSGGGQLEGEGSSRSKYVFGASTPKSMWDPVSWQRQARRIGTSLLDSPGLPGGHSTASIPLEQERTPRPTTQPGARSRTATPSWQRPSTPTRSSGAEGAPRGAITPQAPPQRPRSAQAPPTSPSRPSSGGAGSTTRRLTGGGGAGRGASTGGVSGGLEHNPVAANVRQSPQSRSRPTVPPASPGRGRSAATVAVKASPRNSTSRLSFATPPSPIRSSGGGSLAIRGRSSVGAGSGRRGLMDGDTTSGASTSPSPERRIRPSSAIRAAAVRQGRGGLADTESSASPQPRSRPPLDLERVSPAPVGGAAGSTAGTGSGVSGPVAEAPQSRRSSAASGGARQDSGQTVSRLRNTGPGTVATAPPLSPQASATSINQHLPKGPSRRISGSTDAGLPAREVGGAAARTSTTGSVSGAPSGRASASGTGTSSVRAPTAETAADGAPRALATGSTGAGSAFGSRQPSTTSPSILQQDSSKTSETSSTSGTGGGPGPVRGSGIGSVAPRSPLSRSPVSGSPPLASPRTASPQTLSPPSQSPPLASPPALESPQQSQPRLSAVVAVESEITEGSGGLGQEDDFLLDGYAVDAEEGDQDDYAVDAEEGDQDDYAVDAEEGDQDDYGDEGGTSGDNY